MSNKTLRNIIIALELIIFAGTIYIVVFVLELKYATQFADQVLYITLGILALNSFFKIILLRKHKLQVEAKINSNNLEAVLDSDIIEGKDDEETILTYPGPHLALQSAQLIITLMVILLFFQAFDFANRFWIRFFTTSVLVGSTILTFIYYLYMNNDEEV